MTPSAGRLRKLLLGIAIEETSFAHRGFCAADSLARDRLELSGATFLEGYHTALEAGDPFAVAPRLNAVDSELRGFAFEGAAMGFMLMDLLTPWKTTRLRVFLGGPAADHIYMAHVGAGWAMARIPWGFRQLQSMDRLLRWLAVDGYGFHQGYFHPRDYIESARPANVPVGYARCAFDQGLGRSLWFVHGADVEAIARTIGRFSAERRAHLWSGAGLAAAYAGGVGLTEFERLREHAGAHRPSLAQGVAFAAKARARAGNPARHTELGCQVLCGMSASAAADITDKALQGLPASISIEPYEAWRSRIRARFSVAPETLS